MNFIFTSDKAMNLNKIK